MHRGLGGRDHPGGIVLSKEGRDRPGSNSRLRAAGARCTGRWSPHRSSSTRCTCSCSSCASSPAAATGHRAPV